MQFLGEKVGHVQIATMDAANTPRTTRDALTLELLGDIGRCDDKVTALEKKLDALPEALEKAMSPMLGALALPARRRHVLGARVGTG